MALPTPFRLALTGIAVVLSIGVSHAEAVSTDDFVPRDLPLTLSGSYLAGRSADSANDVEAAVSYFGNALESDPDNAQLIERLLILKIAKGELEGAQALAERLLVVDARNPVARLVIGARLLKEGSYDKVKAELGQSAQAPLAVLTGGLLSAWADYGLGKTDEALKTIDALSGPTWYGIFKDYHRALIADLAGRQDDAVAAIGNAFKTDGAALRVVEAYARIMARAGKRFEATEALLSFEQQNHPVIKALLADLNAGKSPGPVVTTPREGAAEVLYGLGSAIGTDEGAELPAAYLQTAYYLDPKADLALMALGDVLQAAERCSEAIAVYGRIPAASSVRRNADIQTGLCLDTLDKPDEGASHIKKVVDANPADLEAVAALGNIYRAHDRFAEAAEAYSKGIATIANPDKADWRIFYFRGIALERSKRWPEAEADFKQALKISPNQPQVLNYLGYSWVDQHLNLTEALEMIKAAVDLRPNDGYIIDSLGWAYYRLGRYQDAVEQLERAVELRAEDSVINDHLGDAYWKVGRKREATFQWRHARDLDPEPAEREKIVRKLEDGMPADGGNDG